MVYRDYEDCKNSVEELYKNMYINQSYSKKIRLSHLLKYNKPLCITEAIYFLNKVIDSSDPDTSHEQIYHGYQTAETLRNVCFKNEIFKDIYIKDNVNKFIEQYLLKLFKSKKPNKKISYIYENFIKKNFHLKKFNLDEESFFIEFKTKILNG